MPDLSPHLTSYKLITVDPIRHASSRHTNEIAALLKFLQATYRELYPQQHDYTHLKSTVERYYSSQTPLWFVTAPAPQEAVKIACLWMGLAIDQVSGVRHPNIFSIYVEPTYRRQGIGRALLEHAQTWAKSQGYTQIGLQVFTTNQPAIDLYQQLGYQPRSISMMLDL
jgi:ribosomal protein S18 acetylase RimI-like enzyme